MTPEIDYSTKNIPSCCASIRVGNLRNLIAHTKISAIRGINDDVHISRFLPTATNKVDMTRQKVNSALWNSDLIGTLR